jgi:hypothetical protein
VSDRNSPRPGAGTPGDDLRQLDYQLRDVAADTREALSGAKNLVAQLTVLAQSLLEMAALINRMRIGRP